MPRFSKYDVEIQIQKIFQDVLRLPNLLPSNMTDQLKHATWDSLTHAQLVIEVELKFNIRFTRKEIISLSCFNNFVRLTLEKIDAKGAGSK